MNWLNTFIKKYTQMDNFYDLADSKSVGDVGLPERVGTMVVPETEDLKLYQADVNVMNSRPMSPTVPNTPIVMTDEGDVVHRDTKAEQIPVEVKNNAGILDNVTDMIYNLIFK
jgi:hypothetical protein